MVYAFVKTVLLPLLSHRKNNILEVLNYAVGFFYSSVEYKQHAGFLKASISVNKRLRVFIFPAKNIIQTNLVLFSNSFRTVYLFFYWVAGLA